MFEVDPNQPWTYIDESLRVRTGLRKDIVVGDLLQ